MIYIFCALYKEAQPLIEHYDLHKCDEYSPFDSFIGDQIVLIISGVGKVRIASAVGFVFGKHKPSKSDFALNLGSCAGLMPGNAYLINSIHDVSSGRDFYPDMIYSSCIQEGKVITSDTVVNSVDSDNCLYDMEASAFYESASLYFAPSGISVIKCVSDSGIDNGVTAASIYEAISANVELISEYISTLISVSDQGLEYDSSELEQLLDEYSEELHTSEYMRIELKAIIKYCLLSKIDFEQLISVYLPVNDRKEGKRVLEKLYEEFV